MRGKRSNRSHRIRSDTWQGGVTLIEMVMTIMIMGILAGMAAPMFSSTFGAYDALSETTTTLGKLRYAVERMAREVREVRHTGGGFDISSMTAGTLTFVKRDGTTVALTSSGSNVTLYYSVPSAVTSPLTDQLNSLSFTYYKANGTTTTSSNADVAFVEIGLTLEKDGNTYPQRTRVALRNTQ